MTDTPTNSLEANRMKLDTSSNTLDSTKAKQSIAEVETNQGSVATIKALIDSIIDSIAKNQSMLTRAALFWGKMPLWQKIGIGILLIAPTLILGIILQLTALIIISALTLIAYIPTSYILDNHYEHDEQVTDKLKDSMTIMATSLEAVLETMDEIKSKLADQIESFHNENERLTTGIIDLSSKIDLLMQESRELIKTEQELRVIQLELENTEKKLRRSVDEHTELLQKNKQELENTSKAFEENQTELSKTTLELEKVRSELSKEIDKNLKVTAALKKTVEEIAPTFIMDEEIIIEFQKKLEQFISDKEKTCVQLVQRICDATKELSLVKDELQRTECRFKALLERQAQSVDQLAKKSESAPSQSKPDAQKTSSADNAKKIQKFGINARQRQNHVTILSAENETRTVLVR